MSEKDMTVTRLAEAIFGEKAGPTYCYYAKQAINAIAADPSLAGFPAHVASEWDYGIPVTSPIILLPDPAPELPSVREQVAAMIQDGMDNGQYPDAIMRSLLAEFDITPKAPRP